MYIAIIKGIGENQLRQIKDLWDWIHSETDWNIIAYYSNSTCQTRHKQKERIVRSWSGVKKKKNPGTIWQLFNRGFKVGEAQERKGPSASEKTSRGFEEDLSAHMSSREWSEVEELQLVRRCLTKIEFVYWEILVMDYSWLDILTPKWCLISKARQLQKRK